MNLEKYKNKLSECCKEIAKYLPDNVAAWIAQHKQPVCLGAIAIGLVLLLFTTFTLVSCRSNVTEISDTSHNVVYIHIEPGMSSMSIGKLLVDKGVIDSSSKFWLATKLNGADSKFQVGNFMLQKNMKAADALNILVNGHTVSVRVTIPEGKNVREVAKIFAEAGLTTEEAFLKKAKSYTPYDYIEKDPQADYAIEGFLFPDTYDFGNDATPQALMDRMVEEFDHKLTPEMRAIAKEKNLSIYQLITLASLVEKEARFPEDRPIIAQVFFKRLAISMPLQTDTTLQYLMDAPKEDVSIADTKLESPYNTYQHYGLPPGPIASPGMASIEAVLHPADTNYLYFVADRNGHNYYSNTYDEHLNIVEQVR